MPHDNIPTPLRLAIRRGGLTWGGAMGRTSLFLSSALLHAYAGLRLLPPAD